MTDSDRIKELETELEQVKEKLKKSETARATLMSTEADMFKEWRERLQAANRVLLLAKHAAPRLPTFEVYSLVDCAVNHMECALARLEQQVGETGFRPPFG